MAVHWKIPFKSIDNISYEIRIYDDSYTSSTPVTLVGAATPFVTQEDDDDDVFTPIRTQTGYIRIFDNGEDASGTSLGDDWWRSLIPVGALDRKVEVYSGSSVVWRGFIQPQSFSGDIYNGPQEREFPVCDRLTALKCWDVIPSDNQTTSFGTLIYYVFTNIISMMTTNFWFSGGATYIPDWLKKQVSWENFGERDNANVLQPKYSCYEMLEEVCKFFGWTCRCYGDSVYFDMSGYSRSWLSLSAENLRLLGIGSAYSSSTSQASVRFSLPGSFASKQNSETYLQGWRKSTVEADVAKTTALVEYPTQEVWNVFKDLTPRQTQAAHSEYLFEKKPYMTSPFYTSIPAKDVDMLFNVVGSSPSKLSNPYIFAYLSERNPHSVAYNQTLYVRGTSGSMYTYLFKMTSHYKYWLNDGIIVISGKTSNYYEDSVNQRVVTYDGYGNLTCVLKVGNKYWTGFTWSTNYSTFIIMTGGSDRPNQTAHTEGVGSIWNTHYWDSAYPDYEGWGIEVGSGVGGTVEFNIIGFEDPTTGGDAINEICIQDLKIEFFRKNTEAVPNEDSTNKYTASGNQLFYNEKEIKTIFTCDNNNSFGTGIIANPDGTYCQTLTFDDGTMSAGQHLANRMSAFGNKTRRMISLEMTGGDTSAYNPRYVLNYDSVDYVPIAISHDWRDSVYTMKFVEIDN